MLNNHVYLIVPEFILPYFLSQDFLEAKVLKKCVGSSCCRRHIMRYPVDAAMMLLKDTWRCCEGVTSSQRD